MAETLIPFNLKKILISRAQYKVFLSNNMWIFFSKANFFNKREAKYEIQIKPAIN